MAKRKAKANGKTHAKKQKPDNPKIPAGANRRAIAVLTRNLRVEIEKVEELEQGLREKKKRLFDIYKNDTGRSLVAVKRILQLAKMDPIVRDTLLKDEMSICEDLAIAPDMPLFAEAAKEQAAVDAAMNDQVLPGYIEGMGRDAFAARRTMDQHPFPPDAKDVIEKWQNGFIAAQTEKDEADEKKRQERAAAKAAKGADLDAGAAAE